MVLPFSATLRGDAVLLPGQDGFLKARAEKAVRFFGGGRTKVKRQSK